MSDEHKDNAEPEKLSLGGKARFVFLIIFFSLFCFYVYSVKSDFMRSSLPIMPGVFLIVIIGSVFSAGYCAQRLFTPSRLGSNYRKMGKGITLFSLVMCIIVILILPEMSRHGHFPYDSAIRANLHNMHLACKAYWTDKGDDKNCDVDIASRTSYGYIQSKGMLVSGGGNKTTFTATGSHIKWTRIHTMDSLGETKSSDPQAHLRNLYSACKAYWAENGGDKNCDANIASLTTYGYIQSKDILVFGGGTRNTFAAIVRHVKATKTFGIDNSGGIYWMVGNNHER